MPKTGWGATTPSPWACGITGLGIISGPCIGSCPARWDGWWCGSRHCRCSGGYWCTGTNPRRNRRPWMPWPKRLPSLCRALCQSGYAYHLAWGQEQEVDTMADFLEALPRMLRDGGERRPAAPAGLRPAAIPVCPAGSAAAGNDGFALGAGGSGYGGPCIAGFAGALSGRSANHGA